MKHCPDCGSENSQEARFCSTCGGKLSARPDGTERKQVSVLFSDLSGFTALSERLDPEETREIMAGIFARAAEIVGRYGGQIEKFIGDAIMAIFGVPEAHEDDPSRAVRAALELHEAVAELAPELEARIGATVALHSGINTGLVVTGELRFERATAGPLGDTINTAARLMGLASPGEIYIGPETRRFIETAFEVEGLGEKVLKGKTDPIPVARVLGHAAVRHRHSERRGGFVGRQEELGTLLGAVERLLDGKGGAVGIVGGPGTGKTRLVEELCGRISNDIAWVEGCAYPYSLNIPFFVIRSLLNWTWDIRESDSPDVLQTKVREGVEALVKEPGQLMPVIARLYGFEIEGAPFIDREAYRQRLFEAMSRLLAAFSRGRPTLICLQDLHWADASSMDMIRRMIAEPPAPVLFVCNYGPGLSLADSLREIRLDDFSPRQTRQLLASLLEDVHPPGDLIEFVESQADGNPFFVEELVNALVESGALTRSEDTWTLARQPAVTEIPTTIRGIIAARIDRLDDSSRRVVRQAAVLGREFLPGVLDHLLGGEAELEAHLTELVGADFFRVKTRQTEPTYAFKQALTQEVAYEGLLKTERIDLHARAGHAMETLLADRLPEYVETLAIHFTRGGITDKAVHYLVEAGREATARYAIDEASIHFRQAYDLLAGRSRSADEDKALVELLVEWALVHYYHNNVDGMLSLLEKHEEVAGRVGDPELKGMYAAWVGLALYLSEDFAGSLDKLDEAHRIGAHAGSERVVGYANAWKTYTLWFMGREAEAVQAGEIALSAAAHVPEDHYLFFKGQAGAAGAVAATGDLKRARHIGERLVEFSERSGNARAAAAGYASISLALALGTDYDAAIEVARKAKAHSVDPFYRAWATFYEALSLSLAGQIEKSRTAVDELKAYGARYWRSLARPVDAITLLGEGRLSAGMSALLYDLECVRSSGSRWMETFASITLARVYTDIACRTLRIELGTLLRNPGFLVRHVVGAGARARTWLERVVCESEEGEIKVVLGAAHFDLARLDHHEGDREAAGGHLAKAIEIFESHGAGMAISKAKALAERLKLQVDTGQENG